MQDVTPRLASRRLLVASPTLVLQTQILLLDNSSFARVKNQVLVETLEQFDNKLSGTEISFSTSYKSAFFNPNKQDTMQSVDPAQVQKTETTVGDDATEASTNTITILGEGVNLFVLIAIIVAVICIVVLVVVLCLCLAPPDKSVDASKTPLLEKKILKELEVKIEKGAAGMYSMSLQNEHFSRY